MLCHGAQQRRRGTAAFAGMEGHGPTDATPAPGPPLGSEPTWGLGKGRDNLEQGNSLPYGTPCTATRGSF